MMNRPATRLLCASAIALASVPLLHAQREWTTSGADAQRTGWLRYDERLTQKVVRSGEFKFLWKMKFPGETRQLHSLTPPIILDRLIGYRGFKALAFFGAADDRIIAVDTDLARPYWTTVLNYTAATGGQPPSSWECPGGLVAAPSRRTVLAPPALAAGGGNGGGGVRNGSAVGEPGRGAAVLSQAPVARTPPARRPQNADVSRAKRSVAPVPFGGVDPVFVMGSDGFLHTLRSSNGSDAEPPIPFLPPDTRPSALLWVDGMVYTATSNGCGAAPNAVWAIDLAAPEKDRRAKTWKTGGPNIAGSEGVALGTDGTLYVAVGKAEGANGSNADSIVALDRETLTPKGRFTAPGAGFNATPIVVRHKDRDLIAATGDDGRLYVLDGAALGQGDVRTPLAVSGRFSAAGAGAGLATFEHDGTRWILAPAVGAPPAGVTFTANGPAANGRIVAFKLTDEGGTIALTPAWQSRDLISPLAPVVVNGMVFAVSSGEHRPSSASLSAAARAQRSRPAVLYVLDGATGASMWSSGTTVTSFARGGLAAGAGQVYVVTYDNHLYAFGIPMEH